MFKVNMNLSPDLMNDIFLKRTNPYTLRRNDTFSIRQVSSVYHGNEFLSFLGPENWELVPSEIKQSGNLETFKKRIKKRIPLCPCRLCQLCLPGVGFI